MRVSIGALLVLTVTAMGCALAETDAADEEQVDDSEQEFSGRPWYYPWYPPDLDIVKATWGDYKCAGQDVYGKSLPVMYIQDPYDTQQAKDMAYGAWIQNGWHPVYNTINCWPAWEG